MCIALNSSTPEGQKAYLDGMEKSIPFKLELVAPWVSQAKSIIDFGTATGSLAHQLATQYPNANVIGMDLSADAINRCKESYPNLNFQQADILNYSQTSDAVICSSIMHEVFAYQKNTFRNQAVVLQALKNVYQNLNPGGRLVIRDFVRPIPNQLVTLMHLCSDIHEGHSFKDFQDTRNKVYEGPVKEGIYDKYTTTMQQVYEYIFRKDFHDNWDSELNEVYGFWDSTEAIELVQKAGFEIEHYAEMDNLWILDNRIKGKIKISTPIGEYLPPPKYQMLLVASKPLEL